MVYGTREFKNGNKRGYLHFSTGKTVVLNEKELNEFEAKVRNYHREQEMRKEIIKQSQQ